MNVSRLLAFTNSYLKEVGKGIHKKACVVGASVFGGSLVLVKDRDRNYRPKLQIIHELVDDVEVAYIHDIGTDWSEGMNSEGIGIVNAALAVDDDEREKIHTKHGKKSHNGEQIRKAISKKTLIEAIDVLTSYKGGVYGNTIVSDGKMVLTIESSSNHEPVVTKVDPSKITVRTNHGKAYSDIGYTEGVKYFSSIMRQKRSIKALKDVDDPKDVAPALVKARLNDHESVENPVRDTDEMSTTSQLVLDLTKKQMFVYLIPDKVSWKGMKDKLPKDYEPKIDISVFRYEDMEDDNPKIEKVFPKKKD